VEKELAETFDSLRLATASCRVMGHVLFVTCGVRSMVLVLCLCVSQSQQHTFWIASWADVCGWLGWVVLGWVGVGRRGTICGHGKGQTSAAGLSGLFLEYGFVLVSLFRVGRVWYSGCAHKHPMHVSSTGYKVYFVWCCWAGTRARTHLCHRPVVPTMIYYCFARHVGCMSWVVVFPTCVYTLSRQSS